MTSYQQPSATQSDPTLKEKAAEAADQGRHAAGQVAQSATERAQQVTQEAARQARDLVGEAREQARRQAGEQHRSLVQNLRSLSSELGSMIEGSEQQGTARELASQARDRVDGVASWLDQREPGDLVEELRTFARRRPGTFLLGALGAGVVVGRLTRGAVAAHTEDSSSGAADTPEGAAGYAMGGPYGAPPTGELPGPEQGYGATSPYGEAGTEPYSAGGYPNGTPR